MADRATEVALFRYALIREAADASLSTRQRGRLVREIAAGMHPGPGGVEIRVGRSTLDQWIRAWRTGGFAALKPKPRALSLKVPVEMLELAEALKREAPRRTAAHVAQMLAVTHGWAPNERTIQRHFRRIGLTRQALTADKAFGRFEASRPNELWVGDALHGPIVGGHKAILFGYLDDHARLLTGYRWVTAEDTLRAEAALRAGLASRGVPDAVYLDNGSPFVSTQLLGACASLGIRLIHSRPGRPPLIWPIGTDSPPQKPLCCLKFCVGDPPLGLTVVLRMTHDFRGASTVSGCARRGRRVGVGGPSCS